ncbi:MAG TPA: N-acetylmuramoyl-L-alanine amidase [Spirochaetota bacterium]|nr:N-acetylmuramoyl-L-alanine amidase [Spirochaetota bacterium]HOL57158.1 N-acetylmuramoyl-L-alanine amidase [Spirochaetota bacterium]HPP04751.1 N-acetylmuramoyl-L-alanine amidase [Spirochaetota bacterium]
MKKNILIIINIVIISYIFSENYYSINNIISEFKLDVEYDNIRSLLYLKKNDKTALIVLNSNYIFINNKKYFIKDFVKSEIGEYLIPSSAINLIVKYFGGDDYLFNLSENEIANIKKDLDTDYKMDREIKNILDSSNDNQNITKIEKKDKRKIYAIIIDPGHGGKDPGAVGYDEIKEKDIVLRCGLILYELLKKNFTDKKIILTRSSDIFISLENRAKIANSIYEKYGDTLFISIHVNSSLSTKSYGFETWYLTSNYKRDVIKKGEVSEYKDVENVINSMLQDEIYYESKKLAKKIQDNLEKEIGDVSVNRGTKEETYFVIKKSIMPAVLVEIGFNSNKYEAIRLTKYSYLSKIATAIFNGIKDFILEYEKSN